MVASDGVWEFLSNSQVVDLVRPFREKDDIEGACDVLMSESLKRWDEEEQGNVDDITFILVFIN